MAPKQETHKGAVVLTLPDYESWYHWLAKNHGSDAAVWVKYAKKGSGQTSITYEESREAAIIFGWIDGLINGYTETTFLRRFTQRRSKSKWSKINRAIAESLIQSKKIKPSGMAQVTAAMKDGRWDAAYDPPSTIKVPPELKAHFKSNKKAKAFFESISSINRYAFLYRIQTAKRAETRMRHIEKAIKMIGAGQVYHPKK